MLEGTVRTFTTEVLDLIERRMKTIAENTCAAFECGCEFEFKRNYPPTINHEAETEFARTVMADVVGSAQRASSSSRRWAPRTSATSCSRSPAATS